MLTEGKPMNERLLTADYPTGNTPDDTFVLRITSMMRDYKITMNEALEWDFEAFGDFVDRSDYEDMLVADFHYYLFRNTVPETMWEFYTEVFMGERDFEISDKHS